MSQRPIIITSKSFTLQWTKLDGYFAITKENFCLFLQKKCCPNLIYGSVSTWFPLRTTEKKKLVSILWPFFMTKFLKPERDRTIFQSLPE